MTSLLDVAKAMQAAEGKANDVPEPLTLADVARQQQTSAVVEPAQLSNLARQVDADDAARVAKAIAAAATEVKSAEQDAQRVALAQAAQVEATEVESAAAALESACRPIDRPSGSGSNNAGDDEDGYSSFEDTDDDKTPGNKTQTKVKANTKAKSLPLVNQDADADADGGGPDGPERTTPSESKESKELLRAVFHADKSRIREMLDSGDVDANTADQHGWSALHWAASQTHTDVLGSLLSRGGRANLVDHMNGWSPLHVAAVRGAVSCVKLLLSAGADPHLLDLYGDSPADIAAATRGKKRAELLELLHGGDR